METFLTLRNLMVHFDFYADLLCLEGKTHLAKDTETTSSNLFDTGQRLTPLMVPTPLS